MDLDNATTASIEEELDSEISSIRAEIRNLQRRRRFLSSSILSSDTLQKRLKAQQARPSSLPTLSSLNDGISPLVQAAGTHAQSNHYRIAFSTTTFPFTDPSPTPTGTNAKLFGIRIDICTRNGRFTKPYYLLLRRVRAVDEQIRVRVHRHTIPAFIPLERLERLFLPNVLPERGSDDAEEEETLKKTKGNAVARKQDLRAFVREVRRQLVMWHTRLHAVYFLREQLGVVRRGADEYVSEEEEDGIWERDFLAESRMGETRLKKNGLGIVALSPTALEASYVRLEWEDGRVGRFKISNSGMVERAVVIGDAGRDKALEATMTGGDRKVLTILDRLKRYASLTSKDRNGASDSQ